MRIRTGKTEFLRWRRDLGRQPRRNRNHPTSWTWDTHATELHVPAERIEVARRLVEAITAAIEERQLPWQPVMNKGYVAISVPMTPGTQR
ncbi:MAG TPA: hypothetical protein VFU43_06390 [Streptosporangiaceae bacterium]|nr:hypothetical protein [Streptosporangiaceae bacterium]